MADNEDRASPPKSNHGNESRAPKKQRRRFKKVYFEIEEDLCDIERLAHALSLMSYGLEKGLEERGSVWMLADFIKDKCRQIKKTLSRKVV